MPEKVVPAESERQEDNTESIDLFEVLEDRYAYEGFNKFVFYCFMFFAMYQFLMSMYQGASDVFGHMNIIRSKLIPPSKDLFERKEFNEWGLKLMKDVVNTPDFFGDEYALMRVTAYVEPTLCNHSKNHPHSNLVTSQVKSYEEGQPDHR